MPPQALCYGKVLPVVVSPVEGLEFEAPVPVCHDDRADVHRSAVLMHAALVDVGAVAVDLGRGHVVPWCIAVVEAEPGLEHRVKRRVELERTAPDVSGVEVLVVQRHAPDLVVPLQRAMRRGRRGGPQHHTRAQAGGAQRHTQPGLEHPAPGQFLDFRRSRLVLVTHGTSPLLGLSSARPHAIGQPGRVATTDPCGGRRAIAGLPSTGPHCRTDSAPEVSVVTWVHRAPAGSWPSSSAYPSRCAASANAAQAVG
jgi:hypothetical protein